MRLTGAGAPTIKPRNESSGRQGNAQYYYRSGKGSDAPLALTKVREGSVRTWPFTGLFYCAERSGKEDDHDTRNDRRRNGDGGARRPGREASVRLSGRRGAADLRRPVRAEKGAAHPGAARAGRGARGGRLCALDRQGRLRAGHVG